MQRIERLERQNEMLEKQNEELREQVKQLIEVMTGMTRGRLQNEEQINNQGTRVHPLGFELAKVTQATGANNVTATPSQPSVTSTFPPPPPFSGGPYCYNWVPRIPRRI